MFQTVQLPLWLLIVILAFAAVTALSHLLFPSVRWFLRRRAEHVVEKLNTRLERPIEPFKLARRRDMIQRVIYDRDVVEAVQIHAAQTGVREDVAFETAHRYAREIVPSFSATAYFGFGTRVARRLSRFLYNVHFIEKTPGAQEAIDPEATVVYVMNHRSNMDYVLVTYLAAKRSALSYAVGEWARVWPLQSLIKSMGAYFIRRKSRNQLYRRVLARYVQLSTQGGVTQAIFPEGGLSLTGGLAEPKLGLLNYIVEGWEPEGRDIVFVPVAINYDRVLEDRVLISAGRRGDRRFRGSAGEAFLFSMRYVLRRMRGHGHRFGDAAVVAADPVSLSDLADGEDRPSTEELGSLLFERIGAAMPVPLSGLIARAILVGQAQTSSEIVGHVAREARDLTDRQIELPFDPEGIPDLVAKQLSAMERRRKMVLGEAVEVVGDGEDLLLFYAETVAMHFPDPGETIDQVADEKNFSAT